MTDKQEGLVPSQGEIKKLVAEVLNINLANAPVALLQIELARMMLNVIDKLRGELKGSICKLENNIDKFT